jgi:hypothetical protein
MGMGKTIELIGLVLANPAGKLPKLDNYLPTKATLSMLFFCRKPTPQAQNI